MPKVTEIDRQAVWRRVTTSTYTYDANGYVASYTDWNGNVTQYVNDGARPAGHHHRGGGHAVGAHHHHYLSPELPPPVQIVAPGLTTVFTYDASGNLLTHLDRHHDADRPVFDQRPAAYLDVHLRRAGPRADGYRPATDVNDTTTYTYDADGNVSTVTDALGHVTRITSYNPARPALSMTRRQWRGDDAGLRRDRPPDHEHGADGGGQRGHQLRL